MAAPPSYEDATRSDAFSPPPYLLNREGNENPAFQPNTPSRNNDDVIDSSSVLRKALNFTTNEEISCSTSHIQPPTDDVTSLHTTSSVTSATTTRWRLFVKVPNWMIYLQIYTIVEAFAGMFFAYNKMIQKAGGDYDVIYIPPTNNITCIYFNNTTIVGEYGPPSSLGKLCQWVLADGVIWTIAVFSLVLDYLCSSPNKPIEKRFAIWWMIIYFGSFFLGLSGVVFTAEAQSMKNCDVILYVGVGIIAPSNLLLGAYFWFCSNKK